MELNALMLFMPTKDMMQMRIELSYDPAFEAEYIAAGNLIAAEMQGGVIQ